MRNRILDYPALSTDLAALLLRVILGGLFINYGWMKIDNYHQILPMFGDPIGLGSQLSFNLVIFAEFFCGIFVTLGFLTRFTIIPIFITMAVAFFVAHKNDVFQMSPGKQMVFVYMLLCLVIFILGSGRFSVDKLILKSRR